MWSLCLSVSMVLPLIPWPNTCGSCSGLECPPGGATEGNCNVPLYKGTRYQKNINCWNMSIHSKETPTTGCYSSNIAIMYELYEVLPRRALNIQVVNIRGIYWMYEICFVRLIVDWHLLSDIIIIMYRCVILCDYYYFKHWLCTYFFPFVSIKVHLVKAVKLTWARNTILQCIGRLFVQCVCTLSLSK